MISKQQTGWANINKLINFQIVPEEIFHTKELENFRQKNYSQTFSRKTRKGYWNPFELLLIEEGWIWTSLLPSNQTVRPEFAVLEDCLRLLRAAATMPCSPAATLGYKPAHSIAYKCAFRDLVMKENGGDQGCQTSEFM